MHGGYIMVDCEGLDLIKGSTPQIIPGIYTKVTVAYESGSQVVAHNCTWDGVPMSPISCMIVPFNGYYIVTASTLQIVVPVNDSVTINNLVG